MNEQERLDCSAIALRAAYELVEEGSEAQGYIAEALAYADGDVASFDEEDKSCADELRRLHSVNADLLEALRTALDASWNGPMPNYARDKACAAIARAEEVKP